MRSRMASPPNIQSKTGFFGGQPLAAHCFLPCQCFQPAQASNARVAVANMGRYGSMVTKTDAEPSPSSTTIKGPIQQADAKPPATTAPTNVRRSFLLRVVVFIVSMSAV